jgi:hypothetical protein
MLKQQTLAVACKLSVQNQQHTCWICTAAIFHLRCQLQTLQRTTIISLLIFKQSSMTKHAVLCATLAVRQMSAAV